ncbi:hypothetical protein [Streptomyces sp. NPDC058758]|uniref:hypothetical protein n=1 Tax=Streptomyces sp. NPDC058758 TaxID=3346627 RepID=UPI0036CC82AA
MTPRDELRLLPWSGPDSKPCFLSTDDSNSYLSRLADTVEEIQLSSAEDLVTHALEAFSGKRTTSEDLRDLSTDLVGALQCALRIAASRGQRMAVTSHLKRNEDGVVPQPPPPPSS